MSMSFIPGPFKMSSLRQSIITQCLSIKLCVLLPAINCLVLFKCSEAMAFSSDESIKFMQTCEDAMFAAMTKKDQDD